MSGWISTLLLSACTLLWSKERQASLNVGHTWRVYSLETIKKAGQMVACLFRRYENYRAAISCRLCGRHSVIRGPGTYHLERAQQWPPVQCASKLRQTKKRIVTGSSRSCHFCVNRHRPSRLLVSGRAWSRRIVFASVLVFVRLPCAGLLEA
jgi:hypothetical protein